MSPQIKDKSPQKGQITAQDFPEAGNEPGTPQKQTFPDVSDPMTPGTPQQPVAPANTPTTSGRAINPSTPAAAAAGASPKSTPYTGAKRRPVCRPGVKFLLKDNLDVDRTKAVLGVPAPTKLCFSLKSTKRERFEFPYKGDRAVDWNDPDFIAHINKWRDQIFRRRGLIDQTPVGGVQRRSKYSDLEKEYLRYTIKKQMRKTKRWLTGDDWKAITDAHNARFEGKKTRVGEKLANGKKAQIEFEIIRRSTPSLKLQFKRNDLKEIEAEIASEDQIILAPAPAAASSPMKRETEEHNDDDETDGASDDGEGVPMGLEEDTDDEMDDQRPAGNTTGRIPVGAS